MREYVVTWRIDIEADSPEEAARKAREIQLRPNSIANVFTVTERGAPLSRVVDLDACDGRIPKRDSAERN